MEALKKVIGDYIKTGKTDYAILIKGTWGSGKTHFFKNELSKIIENNSLKPLYISLYGIGKLEDLSKALFLAMFPSLQKKSVGKLASGDGIVSSALSTISVSGFNLDLEKMIEKFDISKWVSVGQTKVLCFDDLERAKLDIGLIFGFINNFVEHDGIKTILIANEDEIINDQLKENSADKVQAAIQLLRKNGAEEIQIDEISKMVSSLFRSELSYHKIKEKLVGRTIEYRPDIESILDSITAVYQLDKELKSFLDSNKQTIIKTFRKNGTSNIRALKGALDVFRVVYNTLQKAGQTIINKHELSLLVFVIASYLEMKTDESRIPEFKKMQSRDEYQFTSLMRKDEKPLSYPNKFYNKYFSEGAPESDFSKAVILYIADGFFDMEAFLNEFVDEQNISDPKMEKIKSIFNFSALDDKELKSVVKDVLRYVTQGQIDIPKYLHLFDTFQYLSEIGLVKDSSISLKGRFLRGLHIAFGKTKYEDFREGSGYEPPSHGERTSEYIEIRQVVDDLAEKLRETYWMKVCSELFDLLPDRFEEFRARYYDQSQDFMAVPIFRFYSAQKLIARIKSLRTQDLFQLARMIDRRYADLNFAPNLRQDYDNINILRINIEKRLARVNKKLFVVIGSNSCLGCSERYVQG